MSVGRLRWTWRSRSSTACWSWDARPTSASPEPRQGWGNCARIPDPCTTASGDGRGASAGGAAQPLQRGAGGEPGVAGGGGGAGGGGQGGKGAPPAKKKKKKKTHTAEGA